MKIQKLFLASITIFSLLFNTPSIAVTESKLNAVSIFFATATAALKSKSTFNQLEEAGDSFDVFWAASKFTLYTFGAYCLSRFLLRKHGPNYYFYESGTVLFPCLDGAKLLKRYSKDKETFIIDLKEQFINYNFPLAEAFSQLVNLKNNVDYIREGFTQVLLKDENFDMADKIKSYLGVFNEPSFKKRIDEALVIIKEQPDFYKESNSLQITTQLKAIEESVKKYISDKELSKGLQNIQLGLLSFSSISTK